MAPVSVPYTHKSVAPDLPAPGEYLPLLEEMHTRGWYSNFGPLVRRFEAGLRSAFGTEGETCVTACNATAGLSASLLATGRPGPVLVPAFSFPASLGAVRAAGMKPIVFDVDRDSWAVNCDELNRALASSGATIAMFVAPFGLRRSFVEEIALCRSQGVAVVIDNAAGLGAPRTPSELGENVFEVFSMHATKPFGVGEGGAIFASRSHDSALREALNFALSSAQKAIAVPWGFNGKMSEFHAAVGLAQLARFEGVVRKRQAFASLYLDRLRNFPELKFPSNPKSASWQFFPVLLPNPSIAANFVEAAAEIGVEIRRYYRPSLSCWPGAETCGACTVAEDLADRMVVLPMRSQSSDKEADGLIEITIGALERVLALREGRDSGAA